MKKKFLPRLPMLVLVISMLSFICIADAGESDFVKLTLESSYQVEIPKSWKVRDENLNKTIQNFTDSKLSAANIKQNAGDNHILISASTYAGESSVASASARLSVRKTKTLSQKDIKQATQDDLKELFNETQAIADKTAKAISKDHSSKVIAVTRQIINGKYCISTETDMDSGDNKITRQIIDVYHLGNRNVKMTVSYNLAVAQTYKPIVNKIRNSLIIK